jgi:hypothetical protein
MQMLTMEMQWIEHAGHANGARVEHADVEQDMPMGDALEMLMLNRTCRWEMRWKC